MGREELEKEGTLSFDVICVEGYAYFRDDGVEVEKCSECEAPSDNSTTAIGYSLSLDCRRVCEPRSGPTPAPTPLPCVDMMEDPVLIETKGLNIDLPDGTVTVTQTTGDSAVIVIKNLFDEAANFSAFHMGSDLSYTCDSREELEKEGTLSFDVICVEGYADFNFYAYFGDDGVEVEKCSECEAPSDNSTTAVGFSLSIDCSEICPGEPTPAPTPGDDAPACPTEAPPPPSCPDDIVLMSESDTEWPFNPIKIVDQSYNTVTFTVTNPFNSTVTAMYYQYSAAHTGNTECYADDPVFPCAETIDITAHCLTHPKVPLALVDVWFVDADVVSSEDADTVPKCCEPVPEDDDLPTVQWSFKVYCETKCPESEGGPARRLAIEAD